MIAYQVVQYRYSKLRRRVSAMGSKENFLGEREEDLDLGRMTGKEEICLKTMLNRRSSKTPGCQDAR